MREVTRLAREASREVMRRLIAIAGDPEEDVRAVIIAGQTILDRAFGRVTDKPPPQVSKQIVDISALSPADLAELNGALAVIKRLTGREPGTG